MTRVQGSKGCGHSPRNKFVQGVAIAIESGKAEPDAANADVTWDQLSTEPMSGRAVVLEHLAARRQPSSITIQHAISHSKVGAASGEVTLPNGHSTLLPYI